MTLKMKNTSPTSSDTLGRMEYILRSKRVFVFDWDGTILDSMKIKIENFRQAFCSVFEGRHEQELPVQVVRQYRRLSGHPRKLIFFQIMAILGKEPETGSFERFNDAFEKLNKANLKYARVFPDALVLLEELIKRDHNIFISSSVPPQELVELTEATLPSPIRDGITAILGSRDGHAKGEGHLQTIIKQTGCPKDQLLVFGDDPADHELSSKAGIDCILVDHSGISARQGVMMVCSLEQIVDWLPK